MLSLIGILIVVIGFALRLNPLLVVTVAGISTGLVSGRGPVEVVGLFGKAFIESRYVAVIWLVLPVIGMLERAGLKERANETISRIKAATTGRVLLAYLAIRQLTAAMGLVSLGGHAQMVRPLVAPMAEGAAEHLYGELTEETRATIRANAAAVDNIGVFFGEDIFIAIGSILLIKGFLEQNGIIVEPANARSLGNSNCHLRLRRTRRTTDAARSPSRTCLQEESRRAARAGRMIRLEFIYVLMGLMLLAISIINVRDASNPKRHVNALFWGIYAITFLVGSYLPDVVNGSLVIVMVLVGSIGKLGQGDARTTTRDERIASAKRWGNRLYVPVLLVPICTLLGSTFLKGVAMNGAPLIDPKQVTVISLGLATLIALIVGVLMLRPPAASPLHEARRLMDSVGWAAVLPQSLAALGAVFAAAGVGQVIAKLAGDYLPLGTPLAAVITYAVGMALFTIIMGNAFAAFPVITAGIGLPLVVQQFGGDIVVVSAVGMLSGFCGTLMTPMAANYNIVPAALLELKDKYAVIKTQIPTGLILLVANIIIMYTFAFKRS